MGHEEKPKEDIRCIICKKLITDKDMTEGKVEMIKGPEPVIDHEIITGFKKVFVCVCHKGVAEEIKEENSESDAADHQYYK